MDRVKTLSGRGVGLGHFAASEKPSGSIAKTPHLAGTDRDGPAFPIRAQRRRAPTRKGTDMHGVGIIGAIIIGILAGWIAEHLTGNRGGLLGSLVVGLIGSFIGAFIAGALGINFAGFWGSLIVSIIGAVLLLLIWSAVRRRA
jgi:uncharacterized membrane protein YeaQ/YmgE (transglycosylase-associated protein family)